MTVIPQSQTQMLSWFEAHAPVWAAHGAEIGLTVAQTATVTALTANGRASFDAAETLNLEKLAAYEAKGISLSQLRSFGGQMVTFIRAFAQSTSNPNVYAIAQIPPPSSPTAQPPENPFNIAFNLLPTGQLEIKWKGKSNGGSTSYSVTRSVQTEPNGPFSAPHTTAFVGEKSFIDGTMPECTIAATYVITAHKGVYTTAGSVPATARFVPAPKADGTMQLAA